MRFNTNRVLLCVAYLVMLVYVVWPLVERPEVMDHVPNLLAAVFIGASFFTIALDAPRSVVTVVAWLNAAVGGTALVLSCFQLIRGLGDDVDRNVIPLVFYFCVVVPFVAARTLLSSRSSVGPYGKASSES